MALNQTMEETFVQYLLHRGGFMFLWLPRGIYLLGPLGGLASYGIIDVIISEGILLGVLYAAYKSQEPKNQHEEKAES
jgi:hypothetical protein